MAITSFIPELWAARLLNHYRRKLVFGALVNRNYEGEIAQYGDTVHINGLEDITVKTYTPNTKIEDPEQLNTEEQTLVIDHGRYYNFYVDDVDAAQARADLMDSAMSRAATQLAEDTEDFIAEKIVTGGEIKLDGALTAESVYGEIIRIKTAMDEANVSREGRNLVVPPTVEGLLLQNNLVISVNGQTTTNDLTSGIVGRVAGFTVYVSNADAVKSAMVAFNADAVTFANQLTKTEAYRPEARFADAVKGLNLSGAKVTRPETVAVYTISA